MHNNVNVYLLKATFNTLLNGVKVDSVHSSLIYHM